MIITQKMARSISESVGDVAPTNTAECDKKHCEMIDIVVIINYFSHNI